MQKTLTRNGKGFLKTKRPLPIGKGLANNDVVANKAGRLILRNDDLAVKATPL